MDFSARSYKKELLDRDDIPFADIKQNMRELDFINAKLGGHKITLEGVKTMMKRITLSLLSFACLCLAVSAIVAQDIQTRGSINGEVKDKNGAAIVGATVKVAGQTGERTTTTNEQGLFSVEALVPGNYTQRMMAANTRMTLKQKS